MAEQRTKIEENNLKNISEIVGQRLIDEQNKIETNNQDIDCIISSKEIYSNLALNEDGDAKIYKKLFKDKFLYDHSLGSWFYWNDHYWREDYIENALSSVSDVYRKVYDIELQRQQWSKVIAEKKGDDEALKECNYKIKALLKRISTLQTVKRKNSVLKLARAGINSLGVTGDKWDQKPWLLACPNGCIDLETGIFSPGEPKDFIKTVCPTPWDDINTDCKPWIQYLHEIFNYNNDLVEYIQRFLGYCLTGITKEDVYVILYGEHGRNGKGTLVEIIKIILGELAHVVPSDFLMTQSITSNKGPDAEMASLRGKRLVWSSESNKGDKLDVGKVKMLSGSDTISARAPHAVRAIQYPPTHKLLIMTNRRPRVPADDSAFWHRTHVVPLTLSFVVKPTKDYERLVNKDLKKQLLECKSGILAWLVRGCLKWQEEGLNPPAIVINATKEYRDFEDIIGQFVEERCLEHPEFKEKPKDLYENYKDWCFENGHYKLAKKQFLHEMKSKFKMIRISVNYFKGLKLLFPGEEKENE